MRNIREANPACELIPMESQTIEGEFTGSTIGRGCCSLTHLVMLGGAAIMAAVQNDGQRRDVATCVFITCAETNF
jgi:hypothetical protein